MGRRSARSIKSIVEGLGVLAVECLASRIGHFGRRREVWQE